MPTTDTVRAPAPVEPRPNSKTTAITALLRRREGVTLDELTGGTGWQPYTARAALTGLKKNGPPDRAREGGRQQPLPHHERG